MVGYGFVDLVAERFDAGVRLSETLAQDMIAVHRSRPADGSRRLASLLRETRAAAIAR
jgi:hypothetical protein